MRQQHQPAQQLLYQVGAGKTAVYSLQCNHVSTNNQLQASLRHITNCR